ncbi:hypothetical protein [uncultured Methylobacterium sp.]|uniref:hypothetical protein n=1 Tax=uncultured Methylobacterium sp. TaxID=157278 RepID=UPI0035CC2EBF
MTWLDQVVANTYGIAAHRGHVIDNLTVGHWRDDLTNTFTLRAAWDGPKGRVVRELGPFDHHKVSYMEAAESIYGLFPEPVVDPTTDGPRI